MIWTKNNLNSSLPFFYASKAYQYESENKEFCLNVGCSTIGVQTKNFAYFFPAAFFGSFDYFLMAGSGFKKPRLTSREHLHHSERLSQDPLIFRRYQGKLAAHIVTDEVF